ncbi:MAG: succinoglycan biosynthesis protein ExoA [Acidimicrobiaceae bacterium]|nr:succinoglycan biosynthesis protein ExoA [Acidimicrobiaceae bacterium]
MARGARDLADESRTRERIKTTARDADSYRVASSARAGTIEASVAGGPLKTLMSAAAPSVTIVIPVLNERPWISDCLQSLRRQDTPIREILVVDGGSTDGTRDLVAAVGANDARVRLLENPGRSAAAAMNVGLAGAAGEFLVRADAHALYAPDFVRRSVEVLAETGAADVGGPMRPVGTTRFGRAVAAVTSTRFGMGSGAFHWTTKRRVVDTVYLGCYRTTTLRDLGGYDETDLQWAAEDQELNFRLRQRAATIVCDPSVRSWYFPRDSPRALWRQYRNYGLCKVSTLVKHHTLPTLRPLAPPALVAVLVVSGSAAAWTRKPLLATPIAAWVAVVAALSARLGRQPGVDPARASLALAICHVSYGIGFWVGLGRVMVGRRFETRPRGRR